jgi:hypothetical protein
MKFRIWCAHDGRWILSYREGHQRNWRYYAEGKTPMEAFGKMPNSAGMNRGIEILIEFKKEGEE